MGVRGTNLERVSLPWATGRGDPDGTKAAEPMGRRALTATLSRRSHNASATSLSLKRGHTPDGTRTAAGWMDIILHLLLRVHLVITLHLQIQRCVNDTISLCGANKKKLNLSTDT